MTQVFFDADEREQLCDLFERLGPDAPTLLESWTTYDLAAHLVLREHDVVGAPGLVVPGPWSRVAERRRIALKQRDFEDLVATIRSGPPRGFFRLPWVRRVANLNELFVHHEDVRRANGLGPRALPREQQTALFHNVTLGRRLLARRMRGAGLDLVDAANGAVAHARAGDPTASVRGQPGELLLFLFGRGDAADVEITGPPDAVAAVRATRFGM